MNCRCTFCSSFEIFQGFTHLSSWNDVLRWALPGVYIRVCVSVWCACVRVCECACLCVCAAVLFTSIVGFHGSFPHPTSTSILNRMKTTLEKEDNHMFSDTKSLGEVTSV